MFPDHRLEACVALTLRRTAYVRHDRQPPPLLLDTPHESHPPVPCAAGTLSFFLRRFPPQAGQEGFSWPQTRYSNW